jgi:hypothetical protein
MFAMFWMVEATKGSAVDLSAALAVEAIEADTDCEDIALAMDP